MACPKNLRCFDSFVLFAPSRVGMKDSSRDCVADVSRKDAKAPRFETEIWPLDVSVLFAPLRLCVSDRISCIESDRPAITTQPNRREDECGGECQSDPEIRRAQISSRSQLGQRMNVWVILALEIKSLRCESCQAIPQHFDKMRGVEGNRFENAYREQRYYRPKKSRAPRPT